MPSTVLVGVGDSLTTNVGYNLSPFFWWNGLAAGGALVLTHNLGVAGETTAQILARMDNAYNAGSPGLAGIGTIGHIDHRSATNDARNSTTWASLSSTYAALLAKYKTYLAPEGKVYVHDVPPIGTGEAGYVAKNLLTLDYNAGLDTLCAGDPQLVRVHDCVNLRDGSGVQLPQFFQADTIHFNGAGVQQMGIDGASELASLFANFAYPSPLVSDAGHVYPTFDQWNDNHVMAGTGGSAGSGWIGQVADGYSVGSNGSGIAGSLSKVVDTYTWQRITPSQVTRTGAGESIRLTKALTGRSVTSSVPAVLDFLLLVRLSGLDTTYFSAVTAWVQGNTSGGKLTPDLQLRMGGGVTSQTVPLRHKLARPSANTESGLTMYVDLEIAANNTGGMGSVDFALLTPEG